MATITGNTSYETREQISAKIADFLRQMQAEARGEIREERPDPDLIINGDRINFRLKINSRTTSWRTASRSDLKDIKETYFPNPIQKSAKVYHALEDPNYGVQIHLYGDYKYLSTIERKTLSLPLDNAKSL